LGKGWVQARRLADGDDEVGHSGHFCHHRRDSDGKSALWRAI